MAGNCPNCGSEGGDAYCPRCGQKAVHEGDLSLAHAWHHLLHETIHLDGRIFRTVRLLFTRPGQLTLDFLEGRRARHVHPLRLFLVFSAVFFLVRASTVTSNDVFTSAKAVGALMTQMKAKADREGVAHETVVQRTNARLALIHKSAYLAAVLANGLWLWLFFRRQRRYLAEHMVLALHLACFAMTVQMAIALLARWHGGVSSNVVTTAGIPVVFMYLAWAVRRSYFLGLFPVAAQLRLGAVALLAAVGGIAIPGLAIRYFLPRLVQ